MNIKTILAAVVLFGIILLLFISTNYSTSITPEFDRSNNPMKITVYTYKNRDQLNKAHPGKKELNRRGWALWYEKDSSECEIHILQGKGLDDDITLSWGHELQHCIYGRFHQ